MAGLDDTTFKVYFIESSERAKTTIDILQKSVQCPLTPKIIYDELREIQINIVENDKDKLRSFALGSRGQTFTFVAKNKEKRDAILYEILTRFPSNNINQMHWKTIITSTTGKQLIIDHDPELYDDQESAMGSIAMSELDEDRFLSDTPTNELSDRQTRTQSASDRDMSDFETDGNQPQTLEQDSTFQSPESMISPKSEDYTRDSRDEELQNLRRQTEAMQQTQLEMVARESQIEDQYLQKMQQQQDQWDDWESRGARILGEGAVDEGEREWWCGRQWRNRKFIGIDTEYGMNSLG